jgi:hypothetical protein
MQFIIDVSSVHANKYGTDVVVKQLLASGEYKGTSNHIKVIGAQ